MAPDISTRESIRWIPQLASEPTSTIVLTSAERRFVDIRIMLEAIPDDLNEQQILPDSCVDWAMGGKSSSSSERDENGNIVTHAEWAHWVDSRTREVDGVVDKGDMVSLDEIRTLETGAMINPETGLQTDYEEVWIDEPVQCTTNSPSGVKECVVLVLYDKSSRVQGMIIRLGQYCQAVLRIDDSFALHRWQWSSSGGEAIWKQTIKVGHLDIPCNIAIEQGNLEAGSVVRYKGQEWHVEEFTRF